MLFWKWKLFWSVHPLTLRSLLETLVLTPWEGCFLQSFMSFLNLGDKIRVHKIPREWSFVFSPRLIIVAYKTSSPSPWLHWHWAKVSLGSSGWIVKSSSRRLLSNGFKPSLGSLTFLLTHHHKRKTQQKGNRKNDDICLSLATTLSLDDTHRNNKAIPSINFGCCCWCYQQR